MKRIFIIGGMGAGKSTATKALIAMGLPYIDLDKVGHEVLTWEVVVEELVEAFGERILDAEGGIDRRKLALVAFETPAATRTLNRITMPRIEEAYVELAAALEADGAQWVAVECSVFKNREMSMAYSADIVVAILASLETRIERAVAAGWDEADVRNRIARQISDADRAEVADVVFYNDGTREELTNQVIAWWQGLNRSE